MDIQQLQKEIFEIRNMVLGKKIRDYELPALSTMAVRLAALNGNVSEYIAKAKVAYMEARAYRKQRRSKTMIEHIKADNSVAYSKEIAELLVIDDRRKEIELYKQYITLKNLKDYTSEQISTIQTHLSTVKSEKININVGNK